MIKKSFVLSGGGSRGFAHLGVVKALQEQGIAPYEISGTSAGALAGAFLADGFSPDEIKDMVVNTSRFELFAWNGFKSGLISMKNMRAFLQKNLRHTRFEELTMPLYVTATNFVNGSQKIFDKGDIIDAIIASSSIPILFPPVYIDGIPYVDGGMSNNLPVEPFSNKKSEVVCSYVNPVKEYTQNEGVMEVMDRAIHLSFRGIVDRSAEGCFLYIEPKNLCGYDLFDINKVAEIFNAGYTFTKVLLQNTKIAV
jgi:NTE family protein